MLGRSDQAVLCYRPGGRKPLEDLAVTPEDSGTTVFGTSVSDIQTGLSVADGAITGTLKYLDSGAIATDWGAGNFMVLDLSDNDFTGLTSVMVGMDPSEGSGLVELINDPDKNGVFKVTNKDVQVFKIVQTDGTKTKTQSFYLGGLTCQKS